MKQRPLRILYHHRTAASDGMRVHIDEIVAALRGHGHVVRVVGPGHDGVRAESPKTGLEAMADAARRLLPAPFFEMAELLYNLPAYLRLSREAKRFRPDVLYERYNLFLLAGLFLKRRHRLPMILEINSPLAAERARFGTLGLRQLARACETMLWRDSDAVLPVTHVLAEQVRKLRGTTAGIHVIPNGARLDLDPRRDAAIVRDRFGLSDAHVILGFAGYVRAWHGVAWALEVLGDLPPQVHLLVVGDGPARPDLQARAAAAGIADRVHFTGNVPHQDISAYVQAFDVALQTAAVAYASPLKLFEYMGFGRAIVAPDQPNIREILENEANALLFDPASYVSFKNAVTRLCLDEALRTRLGAMARKTVETVPFTWEHNAARIEALARRLSPDANAACDVAEARSSIAAAEH